MTGKELSELTGISQSMISNYRNGVDPSDEAKYKILDVLGLKDPELELQRKAKKYSVAQAAMLLEMSQESVRIALQRDMFNPQIGLAIPHPGGTYTYEIFKDRLDGYIAAKDISN